MKKNNHIKKLWLKPSVSKLNIKQNTFGGTGTGAENAKKWGPPVKS